MDGFSCKVILDALWLLLGDPGLRRQLYVAGGILPWLLLGEDSGRLHGDADLLARLEEKGCVTREKQGRGYLYTAALTRAAYLPAESCSLWGRLFGGSPRNFVAALAETDTLTDADIDELAEYLEELKKERK